MSLWHLVWAIPVGIGLTVFLVGLAIVGLCLLSGTSLLKFIDYGDKKFMEPRRNVTLKCSRCGGPAITGFDVKAPYICAKCLAEWEKQKT